MVRERLRCWDGLPDFTVAVPINDSQLFIGVQPVEELGLGLLETREVFQGGAFFQRGSAGMQVAGLGEIVAHGGFSIVYIVFI
jgi:hypothetical protein